MAEINAALRAEVRTRARNRCEYCLTSEDITFFPHEIDHIVAIKHGGDASSGNLALCCSLCNRYKGTDLSSIDPSTAKLERLYNPRTDMWQDHFALQDGQVVALTGVGRVTVRVLQLNRPDRVRERLAGRRAYLI